MNTKREKNDQLFFSLFFFIVSKNDLFSKSKIQVVNVQYANKFTDFRQKNKDEGDEGTKVKGLKSLISKLFIINYSLSIVPIVELLNRRTFLCLSEPETQNYFINSISLKTSAAFSIDCTLANTTERRAFFSRS